jgi:hypothetical protein
VSDTTRQNPLLQTLLFDPRYRQWVRAVGGAAALPEVIAPGGDFDYAGAVRAGVVPETYVHDGRPHWVSSADVAPFAQPVNFKAPWHPAAWMERFVRATGVDPHDADASTWARATAAGAGPRFDRPAAVNRLLAIPGDQW